VTVRGSLRSVAAAAVWMSLVLVGCGGGASSGGSPVATTQVDLPPSYRFVPATISVSTGATVTWTNHDHFTHSVQFLDGGLPPAPLDLKPDATVTFTFPTAGTYHYQCSFHPQNMQGTVTVEQ
jgi:plastocyanin